ncbi:MAG TPA: ATP-binding protein [Acetobacteraceae bacterium]|nr:ATP-binding protein [Acetobacteraceae bacterium]
MRATISIHTSITALVVCTVLPFLVFSGLLVHRSATDQQQQIARTVRTAARSAADDINHMVNGMQLLTLALADSKLLQTGDLAAFHVQASVLSERQNLTTVLYDTAGRQLLNTSVPFGDSLPTDPEAISQVLRTRQADISDLTPDVRTGKPIVEIAVPVMRDHEPVYVLVVEISLAIAAEMTEQLVLPEQTIGLLDREGSIIYRTREPEQDIGLKAPPDVLRRIAGLDEGSLLSSMRTGVPNYIAFSRVKLAGWVLTTSIPQSVLFAPATQSLHRLLALGVGTLLLAGLIAWAIGRAIARPVSGLSRLATALGAGEPTNRPPPTRIREVDAVADAMLVAADSLRQQIEQLAHAMSDLQSEIDERRRVQRQLVQSQKMEAVGQLTGGLAHDFNNLLGIVIGNLDMLRERCAIDPENDELASGALEATLRGAELTRLMLAFARRQPLLPERCDINQVIRVIVGLLRRTLGEDILIDLKLAEDLWPVLIDRVQLEAAITNLATNARHAMPDGGQLTIVTRNTRLDEDYAVAHTELAPGDYASIEVSDTGTGMAPELLDRIFEPFFTTKEPGQGTGLGLSMVFGFLKQSGGHINVYSEVGEGTTFRLYLPPTSEVAASGGTVAEPPPEPGRNETILVVEDSAGLRRVLTRQLTAAGYSVLAVENARTAIEHIETPEVIDLLLTDIVMPGGMNGHELARVAVQLRPNLKTLLTTGFSDMANGGVVVPSSTRILRKPYRKDELLRLVRDALND